MKTRRLYLLTIAALISLLPLLGSCGSTRAYWGVENEYEYSAPGYYRSAPDSHKKHHKKHKKPKHPKPPKKGKAPKHHHHD